MSVVCCLLRVVRCIACCVSSVALRVVCCIVRCLLHAALFCAPRAVRCEPPPAVTRLSVCRRPFLRFAKGRGPLQAYQDMLIAHKLGPSIAGIENMVARARDLVQRWADWKDHYQVSGRLRAHDCEPCDARRCDSRTRSDATWNVAHATRKQRWAG